MCVCMCVCACVRVRACACVHAYLGQDSSHKYDKAFPQGTIQRNLQVHVVVLLLLAQLADLFAVSSFVVGAQQREAGGRVHAGDVAKHERDEYEQRRYLR